MISQVPIPGLSQILTNMARKIKLEVNCTQVGHIVSFDPATCTATVQIDMQFSTVVPDSGGNETNKNFNYPPIEKVPVMVLTGGAALITMPIQAGDLCLISFNDRDISLWQAGQTTQPPPSYRLHALSDAIAWVGLHNVTNVISSYSTTDIQLRGIGGGLVSVAADVLLTSNNGGQVLVKDKVTIANTAQNLKSILDTLLTSLQSNLVTNLPSANATAAQNACATAKSAIDALLN